MKPKDRHYGRYVIPCFTPRRREVLSIMHGVRWAVYKARNGDMHAANKALGNTARWLHLLISEIERLERYCEFLKNIDR